MKVGILTVQVPFMTGGAEVLATSLKRELVRRGCEADIISVPFKWYPPERLLDCMMMARLIDVEEVNGEKIDRVIALKFPAYFAPHPNKILWMLHQHRQAYDLYGTPSSDLSQTDSGCKVAAEIKRWDDHFLPQSRAIYAISQRVVARLSQFNNIKAATLYPPLWAAEKLRCGKFDNYIFFPSRFDHLKRQHLIVEALEQGPTNLRLVLSGQCDSVYGRSLLKRIESSPARSRISVLGFVSEEEKLDLYANCLAVYNGVYDEDYGYLTLEAFYAGKPVITHSDSGGPLEFVRQGENGYIVQPDAEDLVKCLHEIAGNVDKVRDKGKMARRFIEQQDITWDHVVERLLS